ncbi:hypothetical protein I3I95_00825 [bacterium]|nr:hypothetical protein [bacterium]
MKIRNRAASLAVTAGLVAALTLGGGVSAVSALATESASTGTDAAATATTGTGTITVNANKNVNSDKTEISGYQIFTADVIDGTTGSLATKTVSNIAWASDTVATIVNEQIKAVDPTYAGTTAQEAADWLSANASGTGTATIVSSSDAFGKIASALRAAGVSATSVQLDTATTLNSGYWLFVTTTTSTSGATDQVGTAPIYAVVGGSAVTVDQKSDLPTVNKYVQNDAANSSWKSYADSQMSQSINYKLVGTVADVISSYDTYHYYFTDVLGSGLTYDDGSVKVTVSESGSTTEKTVNAASYTVSLASDTNTLTVDFPDLKTITDENGSAITVDANTVVTVYYTAHLNEKAVMASAHNDNTVTLTYSNNPGVKSEGSTTPATVRDYSYQLNLTKVDSANSTTTLAGANFTIQATGADEGAGTQYVQADGSLGTDAHEFTTDASGNIVVKGLDAGTYTVVETKAPDGYNTVKDFTFTILPVYNDATGDLTRLTASTNSSSVVAGVDESTDAVNVVVMDKAGISLPLTGQAGITIAWVAGGALLVLGVAHLVRSRRRDERAE